jgi:hypothetical protein
MKKTEIRILEMLVRVRQWILSHIAAFPEGLRGHELYLTIDTCIKNFDTRSTTQAMHSRGAKEKTVLKRGAHEALHTLMEAMSRTARSMKSAVPGAEEKFRLPSSKEGQTWLAFARGFADEAVPIADEFVSRGMAPDFIDELKARIHAVEQFRDDREHETHERIASTNGVGGAAEQGFNAVREFDAIVRNIYGDNPAELAAWESVSHVERAPRHADDDEEEPPAPPSPPQG